MHLRHRTPPYSPPLLVLGKREPTAVPPLATAPLAGTGSLGRPRGARKAQEGSERPSSRKLLPKGTNGGVPSVRHGGDGRAGLLGRAFGKAYALVRFVARYHGERNHQSLGNRIIEAGDEVGKMVGDVECRERLGGMLRYYYREAA